MITTEVMTRWYKSVCHHEALLAGANFKSKPFKINVKYRATAGTGLPDPLA